MRIVIAEDSVLLRAGLTGLLADAGHEVVSTVDNADELLTVVERHKPDLAVVDVRMPPTFTDDGLRAALQIRARWPEVGILVLSQYVEETYASELLANDTTGLGYLLKDRIADVSEFLDGVAGSARAAPPSTPRSSPSCWPGPAGATRSTACRPASATCSGSWPRGGRTRRSPASWS